MGPTDPITSVQFVQLTPAQIEALWDKVPLGDVTSVYLTQPLLERGDLTVYVYDLSDEAPFASLNEAGELTTHYLA